MMMLSAARSGWAWAAAALFMAVVAPARVGATGTAGPGVPILANDNRHPAGTVQGGTLHLALRAAAGQWQPEGPDGPTVDIEAFGEVGAGSLVVPAPMIRVVEGTEIAISIRNDLRSALTVHGLCTRGGTACPPIEVRPSETRLVQFASGPAGTYHYWASSFGAPVPFRELAGAFVVDAAGASAVNERVMVITEWTSLTPAQLGEILSADDPTEMFLKADPRLTFTINGLSWPATERLTYQVGEPVRWRIINLTSQAHPMHLHGFYFEVESLGDGLRPGEIEPSRRRRVVTQLLPSGGTMALRWVPERAGNWLFHCHIMHHVSPERRLASPPSESGHGGHADAGHGAHGGGHAAAGAGMAGMIVGVTVLPSATGGESTPSREPRRLTLEMQAVNARGNGVTAGFSLTESGHPASAPDAPGPAILLRRDEPVEITVVNHLTEPTAIHWHGLELESIYDGVHGWSGIDQRLAPMIAPGGSFVVRMTPPRAGTFIYHTHLHDYRQLSSGLYGPLIVVGPGETFDATTDHVVVLGRAGLSSAAASVRGEAGSVVINGEHSPRLVVKAGMRHRIRLINITPDDIFNVSLVSGDAPVTWTPLTKDGAPLPAVEAIRGPAKQTIAVGETYDVFFDAPAGQQTFWLEVRTPAGKWQAQAHVLAK